ncbi:MAG: hypothetical protein CMJ59_12470 [Planctomycetaceae bacterium]|nr:hypothetical protein [Planctomycetaceae bacterium]
MNADAEQCPYCNKELSGQSPANIGNAPRVQSSNPNAKMWIIFAVVGGGSRPETNFCDCLRST